MRIICVWHLVAVSTFLATGPILADGDINNGKEKSTLCASCHGLKGEGFAENPALAGLDRKLLESGMQAYKSGDKTEPMMVMLMQGLSDEEIYNLAEYYASLASEK